MQHKLAENRGRQSERPQEQQLELESGSDLGEPSDNSFCELEAVPKRAKMQSQNTALGAGNAMRSIRDDPWWHLPVDHVQLHSHVEQFGYGDSDSDCDSTGQTCIRETCSGTDAVYERTPRVTELLSTATVWPEEAMPEQPESEPRPGLDRVCPSHRMPSTHEAKRQRIG